jgi:hypothetical protein
VIVRLGISMQVRGFACSVVRVGGMGDVGSELKEKI